MASSVRRGPDVLVVGLTADDIKDLAGALAELWIAVHETHKLAGGDLGGPDGDRGDVDTVRMERAKQLVRSWQGIMRQREDLARAEREALKGAHERAG